MASDDLRTRIAEAASNFLSNQFYAYLSDDQALELADAVIRELGLRREIRYTPLFPRMPRRLPTGHRYVTEWETDE